MYHWKKPYDESANANPDNSPTITSAGVTEHGIILGTAAYMSPEQALGQSVDRRSDVYALGCVLYEMLVGEPPYTGPTAQAILARRLNEPLPSVRVVRARMFFSTS